MGNTSCCCSCSSSNVDYKDLISKLDTVKEMSEVDQLISYIDQLLNAIGQERQVATTAQGDSSINSAGGLLEKVLKRYNRHICKKNIMPNLNRETRKFVIDVTNQAAQIKWVGVALSVVGFVLERIDQISSNKDESIELLKYMCYLAKYVRRLDEHLPEEKLNRVIGFIVKGCLMCISQMVSNALSKFFSSPIKAEELRKFQGELGHEYQELSLAAIIAVLNRIPVVLPLSQGISPQTVGLEEARKHVTELLDIKGGSVRVVVIYGQGGMGKTTLAAAVFSKIDLKSYKYCRVDMEQNCSEADLKVMQQQILRDLFGPTIDLRNLNEGRDKLSEEFKKSSQPVFIFIDNALRESDLEKLLPISALPSLPVQSRILLTTRNLNETRVIVQAKLERIAYQVASLPQEDALRVLSLYALGSDQESFHPNIDINCLLNVCQGIPLVLQLAGKRLYEHAHNMQKCKQEVEYLMSWLLEGAKGEISERMVDFVYNRLDASCQEAFLDIVFFFFNWDRSIVAFSIGEIEFQELERAALVNVTDEDRVNVHDIVKARGRMLSPENGERITDVESLTDVLQNVERIKKTKGICLPEDFELEASHLNLMKKCLRVLILTRGTQIVNGKCNEAFENLRLLGLQNNNNYSQMNVSKHQRLAVLILIYDEASNFPEVPSIASSLKYVFIQNATLVHFTTIISQFQTLFSLGLHGCRGFESLPETIGYLDALKTLDLSDCSDLMNLPESFEKLSSLSKLILSSCSSLASLPNSFGNLSSLKELDLNFCSSLTSLSNNFGSLGCLAEIDLSFCSNLPSLPDSFGNLSSLQNLDLRSCSSLTSLSDNFGSLCCLEGIDLSRCSNLPSLPDNFGSLSCLAEIDLSYCSNLPSLPDSFGNLSSLQKLNLISCSSLTSLSDNFGSLGCLEEIYLSGCSNLPSLPDNFGNLSSLQKLDLRSCSNLPSLPDSFGNLSSLQRLDLRSCSSLTSLLDNFGSLGCLEEIYLSGCSNLPSLPDNFGNLSSLQKLDLRSCSNLPSLPDSFGNLSSLQKLDLRSCSNLPSLPNYFGSLGCLAEIDLSRCSNLPSLPDSFGNLSSLQKLDLRSCSSLTSLSDNFGSLGCLEEIYLSGCSNLPSLPDNFGSLGCLTEIDLSHCSNLPSLPDSFGNLSSLQKLDLRSCSNLPSLPDNFGSLGCLAEINLSHCSNLPSLPDSFGNLSCLQKLDLRSCSSLTSLSDNFGSLGCLEEIDLSHCSNLTSLSESFGSLFGLVKLNLGTCTQLSAFPESFGNLGSLETLILKSCEKLLNLPQNFGQLKCLRFLNMDRCRVLQTLSGDFECLSSLVAVGASKCSQLEENTMDKLANMRGLMIVYINKSPVLQRRWEQVKDQYSLSVLTKACWHRGYPYEDVMHRAFFHSESKFLYVDENGLLGESTCPAGGIKLCVLLTASCDLTSPSNRERLEAVKRKWMECDGQMILVEVGSSWEERERRVREILPLLPRGCSAWIAPDNRARLHFAYSLFQLLSVEWCDVIVSISTSVDEEGRTQMHFDCLDHPCPYVEASDHQYNWHEILSPITEAVNFILQYSYL